MPELRNSRTDQARATLRWFGYPEELWHPAWVADDDVDLTEAETRLLEVGVQLARCARLDGDDIEDAIDTTEVFEFLQIPALLLGR